MAAAAITAPALAIPQSGASAPAPSGGALLLKLRRGSNSVDVVVQGTGAAPVLRQRQTASGWQGQLQLNQSASLKVGPQTLTLPEAGLRRVSISGSGRDFQLEVVPMPGAPASKPVVSADGRNLILSFSAPSELVSKTGAFNLNQPGSVPQPRYAPPLQPRAVAPPLGDMAVGTMVLRNRSYLNLSGPPVTMTLRNAPAKDALMAAAAITAPASAIPQSGASAPAPSVSPSVAPSGGALLLQLRRGSNSVDVVVQGTGAAPVLRQRQTASGWQGQLQLNQSAFLKVGPQTLTLPEAGLRLSLIHI